MPVRCLHLRKLARYTVNLLLMLSISLYHFFRAGDALMVEPRARPASKIFEKSDDTEVFQYPPIKAAQLTTLPQVPHY